MGLIMWFGTIVFQLLVLDVVAFGKDLGNIFP